MIEITFHCDNKFCCTNTKYTKDIYTERNPSQHTINNNLYNLYYEAQEAGFNFFDDETLLCFHCSNLFEQYEKYPYQSDNFEECEMCKILAGEFCVSCLNRRYFYSKMQTCPKPTDEIIKLTQ